MRFNAKTRLRPGFFLFHTRHDLAQETLRYEPQEVPMNKIAKIGTAMGLALALSACWGPGPYGMDGPGGGGPGGGPGGDQGGPGGGYSQGGGPGGGDMGGMGGGGGPGGGM
ncbi:hypothetical protein GFGA_1c1231 [Gluconobacter frateurii NBRC 103465]|nr:hypothetical protein GFGA_1c1231 [Gluconobacter frateurii NBRC 103465]